MIWKILSAVMTVICLLLGMLINHLYDSNARVWNEQSVLAKEVFMTKEKLDSIEKIQKERIESSEKRADTLEKKSEELSKASEKRVDTLEKKNEELSKELQQIKERIAVLQPKN